MTTIRFPSEVSEKLNWYVYRLVDPRNGETFYVGKGRGDRIFQHAQARLRPTQKEDALDLKLKRIRDIAAAGLEVGHLIHRHNIENAKIAYEIEAALIDAYPGLANRVAGHGSGYFGVRHVEEIIADYSAKEFEPAEPLILISIARSFEEEDFIIYEAVRGVWRINVAKAKRIKLVLAHRRGLVLGAFRPQEWLPATKQNFPRLVEDIPGRYGFVGKPADDATCKRYLRRRVPDKYRRKGAANPIRFIV